MFSAFFWLALLPEPTPAQPDDSAADWETGWEDELLEEAEPIADPLEPLNRFFFQFNDRLYFWVLNPVATRYERVVPSDIRASFRNFFLNLLAPVRVANNLLQGKPRETGVELSRFLINSTLGIAGLGDPAKDGFGLQPQVEDLGQTLGRYGLGGGIYLVLPFLGPSNLRDTLGLAGDTFLTPLDYLVRAEPAAGLSAYAADYVNSTSFRLGEYENFKKAAFDPYLSLRDAYQQHRDSMIEDRLEERPSVFTEGEPPARQAPAKEMASGEEERPEAAKGPYLVNVGTFVDLQSAQGMRDSLRRLQREAVIRTIDRKDYCFYAVQVPGGDDFLTAKAAELKLIAAGFPETLLVKALE